LIKLLAVTILHFSAMEGQNMADAKYVDGVPLPKLTQAYLNLKAARDELSAEYKKADEKLVNKQNKIKSALLSYLKENDIKSVKTDAGTFYRTVKQKYWTSDWESMHQFILEHEVPKIRFGNDCRNSVKG
jgi:hypothetical protein